MFQMFQNYDWIKTIEIQNVFFRKQDYVSLNTRW